MDRIDGPNARRGYCNHHPETCNCGNENTGVPGSAYERSGIGDIVSDKSGISGSAKARGKKKSKRVKIKSIKGTPIPAKDIAESNDRIKKAMRKFKASGISTRTESEVVHATPLQMFKKLKPYLGHSKKCKFGITFTDLFNRTTTIKECTCGYFEMMKSFKK